MFNRVGSVGPMNGLRTSKSPPQPALRARVAHAPAWKKTLQVEAFVFDLSLKLIGLEQSRFDHSQEES